MIISSTTKFHKTLAAAAVAVCLWACSGGSDGVGEPTPPTAGGDATVMFTTQVDAAQSVTRVTQGPISSLTDLQNLAEGFGVMAYLTEGDRWADVRDRATLTPDFMYNQSVTWGWLRVVTKEEGGSTVVDEDLSTPGWIYTPPKYWPNRTDNTPDRYVSFFAYAPYVDASPQTGLTGETAGITALTYDADRKPYVQYDTDGGHATVDLLYAQCPDATRNGQGLIVLNGDGTRTYQAVPLEFHHALACVDFYVQRIYDEPTYTGKEPTGGENQTKLFVGKLVLDTDDAATPPAYASGRLNLDATTDAARWTGRQTVAADASGHHLLTYGETDFHDLVGGTDRTATTANLPYIRGYELSKWADRTAADGTAVSYGVDASERLLFTSGALMFLPQELTFTPTLTYTMLTRDDKLPAAQSVTDADGHRYSRVVNTVTGNSVRVSFQAGKRYKLVIHISAEHVEIEVAGVEDWDFPLRFRTTVEPFTETGQEAVVNEK